MKLISTLETEKALLLRKLPTLNLAQNRLAQKKIKQIDDEIAAIKKSGIPTLDDMYSERESSYTKAEGTM
jgi:hypothetical protein